jgi:hypothetical protein
MPSNHDWTVSALWMGGLSSWKTASLLDKHAHTLCVTYCLWTVNKRNVGDISGKLHKYCTVMTVLVGITDHATQYLTLFIADYTVGTTIALLQTVLSLTVLTVHTFRRLPWPSTISAGARLFTVGSRLSLPLLSPTTLSALAGWLSRLTACDDDDDDDDDDYSARRLAAAWRLQALFLTAN